MKKSIRILSTALFVVGCLTGCSDTIEPKLSFADPNASAIRLMENGAFQAIPDEKIVSLEITRFPDPNETGEPQVKTYTGRKAVDFLKMMGFMTPLSMGRPAAIQTGEITLTYETNDGAVKQRRFLVLNDRLIEDAEYLDVIYQVSKPYSVQN